MSTPQRHLVAGAWSWWAAAEWRRHCHHADAPCNQIGVIGDLIITLHIWDKAQMS